MFNGSESELDPTNLYIGETWSPAGELCSHDSEKACLGDPGCRWDGDFQSCYNRCWDGCHVHMELSNDTPNTRACWQNVCGDEGRFEAPAWGTRSVIGFLGGADADGDMCPRFEDEEAIACGTWDHGLAGCDAHGYADPDKQDDTQDCAYYTTTDKCRPRGTSNCEAGLDWECGPPQTEACSEFDGDLGACDAHGYADPDKQDDTQDCAYYFLSDRCIARGTTNCVADCDNCIGSGCVNCDQAACPSSHPSIYE